MGNGFTQYEMDDENDLSWYIEKADQPREWRSDGPPR
jgi:hypothetical protein